MISRVLLLTICILATLLPSRVRAAGNYEESLKQLAEGVTAEAVKAKKRRVALVEFTDTKGKTTPIGQFLTDELATQLLVGGELKVIERAQVQAALSGHHVKKVDPAHAKAVSQAAKAIKADVFVLGTYADTPSGVQVTMKLIRPQKADVIGATRGSLPKAGQLAELIKEANAPPVVKTDSGPKKTDVPEGLGFHRNEHYELVVHSVVKQAKQAKVDLTVENKSPRDMKVLCLLQDTTLRDKHGVVWAQRIEDNREGLCTRGIELQPREKERTVLTFAVPSEDGTSVVSLRVHETSPRRGAVFTIEGLKVDGAAPASDAPQ
jgi:TolB-like protein